MALSGNHGFQSDAVPEKEGTLGRGKMASDFVGRRVAGTIGVCGSASTRSSFPAPAASVVVSGARREQVFFLPVTAFQWFLAKFVADGMS